MQMPARNSSYFTIIEALLKGLFVGEKRRLNKSITTLIEQNNELTGIKDAAGFIYMGEFYTSPEFQVMGRGATRKALHENLVPKMEWHIKSAQRVADEERLIGQVIFKLLSACETLQEMRNTLPDFLAEIIPALKKLPRTAEPGCSLSSDTRGYTQFEKLHERMEFYAAARLMY